MTRIPPLIYISILGIPDQDFLEILKTSSQIFTTKFSTIESKNPITMIRDDSPGFTGLLNHNKQIARRKHTLQMKAARLSILSKAIGQKSKFLHKIALFCLIKQIA
jgi:hypothetical protein